MTWDVKSAQIMDVTSKWELAQRLSGHTKAPEQALKCVFKGAMQHLEVVANTKFETSMKERVWEKVSKEKLKTLKETFILEFCDKILGDFNDEAVNEMIEEHKLIGIIKFSMNSIQLQTAYSLTQSSIIDTVVQKANSMIRDWIPEIVNAVKEEGIKLPEPKNQ